MAYTPKVSIILPCYNAEKYLAEAMDSLLTQTYQQIEIICINDGSTDSTFKILTAFAEKDNRVIIINNSENIRLIDTLNKGIAIASGEFIARMDSDDISKPTRIEKQVTFLLQNPGIDMVGTGFEFISSLGHVIEENTPKQFSPLGCFFASFFQVPILHPTLMCKSDTLKDNLFLKAPYTLHTEDYELFSRLARKHYKLANLKESLLYYRISLDSVSRKHTSIQDENFVTCVGIHYNTYFMIPLEKEVQEVLANRIPASLSFSAFKAGIKALNHGFDEVSNINNADFQKHKNEILTIYYTQLFDICWQAIIKTSIPLKLYSFYLLTIHFKMFFFGDFVLYIKQKISKKAQAYLR